MPITSQLLDGTVTVQHDRAVSGDRNNGESLTVTTDRTERLELSAQQAEIALLAQDRHRLSRQIVELETQVEQLEETLEQVTEQHESRRQHLIDTYEDILSARSAESSCRSDSADIASSLRHPIRFLRRIA